MAAVAPEEKTERVRPLLRRVTMVLAGLAAVLLLWAVALGAWSRLAAPRSLGEDAWYVSGLHRWGAALPNGIAISVAAVAVVLAAAIAFSVWRGRRPDTYLPGGPAAWAAIFALLFFAYCSQGLPEFYRTVMNSQPVTSAMPAAVAAWVLSIAGTAATLFAAGAFPRLTRGSVRWLGAGAVIAVVVASVVTVMAVRAGDDERYRDATTAAATDIPAVPADLGRRTFTVALPEAFAANPPAPEFYVAAGGAGFVVYQAGRVTAYGADGKERWHYARTGPGEVAISGMRVFDNTVVLFLDNALVGLDAVTGEQLWSSTDSRLVYAISQQAGYNLDAPFVVYRDQVSWVRYDTRTGTPMWTVPAPHPECGGRDADTRSWLVSVWRCESGGGADIRVLAIDPGNGETRWDSVVLHGAPDLDAVATPANAVGILMQFAGSPGGMSYVNVVDKSVTPLPQRGSGEPSPGPADDFVFSDRGDGRHAVRYGADGRPRCTVTDDVRGVETAVPGQGNGLAYVSFAGSFVVADRNGLRTFDGSTCAQTAQVPAESVQGFVPTPGAVLVLRRDDRTLQIDGYTAG